MATVFYPELEMVDAFPGAMDEDGNGPIIPTLAPDLATLAAATGDITGYLDESALHTLGADVVADYRRDKADRREWEKIAEEALKLASQEAQGETKRYPWPGCSNVNFPLITTAALQYNARSYPAIVKGDEAISIKVVGRDLGKPLMGLDGQPMAQGPDGQQFMASQIMTAPPEVQQMMSVAWQVPPGAKAKRAKRVAEYMNTVLFYRMKDWEADTDSLCMQLPIVGCVFRKVWFDTNAQEHCAAMVSALRIYVPEGARSCDTTPRLTEEIPDVYPHEISEKIRSGYYREVTLDTDEEKKAGARMLLEQQRLIDLDEDGLAEPYIVTVDLESEKVLRIEPNFAPEGVKIDEAGNVLSIERGQFYIKYDFFPHPEGKFYGIGLGHLLKQVGAVIDTALNQLIDAGTAQTAGGGFIASGIRLQGRSSSVTYEPGKYIPVNGVNGTELRNGIVERTLPNVSPVTFQVLDMILGAARDISGVKDVITGEASNNGQVGTTLALIEQGLQVYNAVFKRTYLALKNEFTLLYKNMCRYGVERSKVDYVEVMDDPEADFEKDFSAKDMDIRPVSDPSTSTKMQKAAKAQGLMGTIGLPGANPVAILKRVYEAMDVENPEELIAEPQPDPMVQVKAEGEQAKTQKTIAETQQITVETQLAADKQAYETFAAGFELAA
jgi:chaperonin GroES